MSLAHVLQKIDQDQTACLERFKDSLKIPSVSTDLNFAEDCVKAAQWFEGALKSIGFETTLYKTSGHPIVLAHFKKSTPAPHVLFYGHYDVQPTDPLDKWDTPPFEPDIRPSPRGDLAVYARGASDDKGQVLTFLEACRAWISHVGELPVSVTVLIEGEEETGSPNLLPFLETHGQECSADIALVCDTSMFDPKTPAITTRLRGLLHEEVTIKGPDIDLHSGLYGGIAHNPITLLSKIIGTLHDQTGKVTIPGFYNDVSDIPEDVKKSWEALSFDGDAFLASVGLKSASGERGYSILERIWSRPTAEVNGLWGGYTGMGTKTVIPSEAHAKFSFRLVANQDPKQISEAFRKFVKDQVPLGCDAIFAPWSGGAARAVHVPEDNPFLAKAAQALEDEWSCPTVLMGCGASIPIVKSFQDVLGMESLLIGFALAEDAIHSPNEHYTLQSFYRGIKSWARILWHFSEVKNQSVS